MIFDSLRALSATELAIEAISALTKEEREAAVAELLKRHDAAHAQAAAYGRIIERLRAVLDEEGER